VRRLRYASKSQPSGWHRSPCLGHGSRALIVRKTIIHPGAVARNVVERLSPGGRLGQLGSRVVGTTVGVSPRPTAKARIIAMGYAQMRHCQGLNSSNLPGSGGNRRQGTGRMHHDLDRGKPLAAAWLSGAVVDLDETVGVTTLANRFIRCVFLLQAQGQAA